MKRTLRLTLTCALAAVMCACTATAENLTGEAEGYGGPLKVAVTVEEGKITQVRVTEHKETEGVGTKAIDTLPDAIVQANSTQVDVVAGATYTSKAILAAVDNALGVSPRRKPSSGSDLRNQSAHRRGHERHGPCRPRNGRRRQPSVLLQRGILQRRL